MLSCLGLTSTQWCSSLELRQQGVPCGQGQEHFAPTVSHVFVFKDALISLPLLLFLSFRSKTELFSEDLWLLLVVLPLLPSLL